MKPAGHAPIPPTFRLLWGRFRLRVVPVFFFCVSLAAAGFIWIRFHSAPTLAGVGEGTRAAVASPLPGWLVELQVRPYQFVNQGDAIAVIQPVDPRMPLDLLQAEVELARLRNEPPLAMQRALDYERVRIELLRLEAELATARVNLQKAENDARRSQRLYEERILSEELYDLTAKTRDALAAEVAQKSNSVAQMSRRLEALQAVGIPEAAPPNAQLEALLARLGDTHTAVNSNWGPITIRAPITGMVNFVNRTVGEYVLEGEPIVCIASPWSDRVVAYLRQPYPMDPEVGMRVRVTTRTDQRRQFWALISHVGPQVETITNALAVVRQGVLLDVGLPLVVDLPTRAPVRPGEVVDLWIEPRARNGNRL